MSPFKLSSFLLLAAAWSVAHATTTCNVLDYGGAADGKTDIAPAIMKTYSECVEKATTSDPTDTALLVPVGDYALKTSVTFHDASFFIVEIDGTLDLIFNPTLGGNMFLFDNCHNVVWRGTGVINGNGNLWRPSKSLTTYPSRPHLLCFQDCNNVDISGVKLNNSPTFHVTIIGDSNVAHDMVITADHIGETDGFDISGSNNHVHDVSVENGDECVTVKTPTKGFVAENIQCHYSAGCNIGSFGKDVTGVSVEDVYYRNVTQSQGDAGILLKSYPSASGVVRNITYEDFKFVDLALPIQITYSGQASDCEDATGNLIWENIKFQDITGTGDSSSRPIISISCLPNHKCTNISFEDVDITKEGNTKAKTEVSNACGSGLTEVVAC